MTICSIHSLDQTCLGSVTYGEVTIGFMQNVKWSIVLNCNNNILIIVYLMFFFSFFVSELNRKRSFQSSSSYKPFCPDKTGATSLKDYRLLQNHEQYVQTLKECGFNEEEIQFKLEQEGYITKVSRLYYKGELCLHEDIWATYTPQRSQPASLTYNSVTKLKRR